MDYQIEAYGTIELRLSAAKKIKNVSNNEALVEMKAFLTDSLNKLKLVLDEKLDELGLKWSDDDLRVVQIGSKRIPWRDGIIS